MAVGWLTVLAAASVCALHGHGLSSVGAVWHGQEVSPLPEPPAELAAGRHRRSSSHRKQSGELKNTYTTAKKASRFLNVFQLIRFRNTDCVSTDEGANGTCYLPEECAAAGGRAMGTCARDYGVCCTFSAGCGESTSRNNTLFRGPGNLTAPFNCRLTVKKMNNNICQMRLDFDQLNLAAPDISGVCRQDQFTVVGASSAQPPVICDSNNGQHMYVDVSPGSGSQVTLQVTTSGSQMASRDWKVRVAQIECNSPSRAPPGCLQYHPNVTGTIKSFGFDSGTNGPHLASQRYAICIRTNAGFCGIQYDACDHWCDGRIYATPSDVACAVDSSTLNNFTVSESIGAVKGSSCTTDYLTIAGITADGVTGVAEDRHCGTEWAGINAGSGSGITFSRPFVVYVRFDSTETSVEREGNNRGFCLDYTQVPCTSSISSTGAFSPLVLLPSPLLQQQQQQQPQQQRPTVVSSGVIAVNDPHYDGSGGPRPYRPSLYRSASQSPSEQAAGAPGWNQRRNFYYG